MNKLLTFFFTIYFILGDTFKAYKKTIKRKRYIDGSIIRG